VTPAAVVLWCVVAWFLLVWAIGLVVA